MYYEHKPALSKANPVAPRRLQITMAMTQQAFENLRDGWQTLQAQDPNASIYLSWAWMRRIVRDNPEAWRILIVSDLEQDGAIVGLLPLSLKDGNAYSASRLLGAEYGALLCHPEYEDAVLPLLARAVQTLDWGRLTLSGNAAQGRLRKFLAGFNPAQNRSASLPMDHAQIVLPDNADTYTSELPDRQVAARLVAMRKKREWRSIVSEPAELADDLDSLAQLMAENGASKSEIATKRAQIVNAHHNDALFLVTLREDNRPIGVLAHVMDHDLDRMHVLAFAASKDQSAMDIRCKLHLDCLAWAIRHGFALYDLGTDRDAMTAGFATCVQDVSGICVTRRA